MMKPGVSRIRLVTEEGRQRTLSGGRQDIENWLADVTEHSSGWAPPGENTRLQPQKRVQIAGGAEQTDRDIRISPEISLLKRELTMYRGK